MMIKVILKEKNALLENVLKLLLVNLEKDAYFMHIS